MMGNEASRRQCEVFGLANLQNQSSVCPKRIWSTRVYVCGLGIQDSGYSCSYDFEYDSDSDFCKERKKSYLQHSKVVQIGA